MQRLFLFLLFCCCSLVTLQAQYQYSPRSPKAKVQQQVGDANVKIEYDRPMARGRQIFGGLVPYDEMWHTGASGTTITFDRSVTVAGFAVPAGAYALQVFPRPAEWTVVLSTAKDGIGNYNPEYDVVNVCVPVKQPGRFYEAFSVELDVTPGQGQLYISWTDVQVSLPIETRAIAKTMAHIDSLVAAPGLAGQEDYFRAASYLTFNRVAPEKAVLLLRRSLKLEAKESYYPYEMLTEAYLQLGDKAAALEAVKTGELVTQREFNGEPETIEIFAKRWQQYRQRIEALE